MQDFVPWHGLAGGMLIGISAALLLLLAGRISGISGIVENVLLAERRNLSWSIAYLVGLPLGALLVAAAAPGLSPRIAIGGSWPLVALAGFLVGFGARLGSGCTSGHGVCGLPRLLPRSIVATLVFMATAGMTVFLARHVLA